MSRDDTGSGKVDFFEVTYSEPVVDTSFVAGGQVGREDADQQKARDETADVGPDRYTTGLLGSHPDRRHP